LRLIVSPQTCSTVRPASSNTCSWNSVLSAYPADCSRCGSICPPYYCNRDGAASNQTARPRCWAKYRSGSCAPRSKEEELSSSLSAISPRRWSACIGAWPRLAC
jgi:hypothetical protein